MVVFLERVWKMLFAPVGARPDSRRMLRAGTCVRGVLWTWWHHVSPRRRLAPCTHEEAVEISLEEGRVVFFSFTPVERRVPVLYGLTDLVMGN